MVAKTKPSTYGAMSRRNAPPSSELQTGLIALAQEETQRFNADFPVTLKKGMTIHRVNNGHLFESDKDMAKAYIERGMIEDGYEFPPGYELHPTNAKRSSE